MLETTASFGLLIRSFVRIAQQTSGYEQVIQEMGEFEEAILDEQFDRLKNKLPKILRSSVASDYANEKEYKWAASLREAVSELASAI